MQNFLGDRRGYKYNNNVNMEYIYTTKVVKIGDSRGLIVPKPVLNGLGWQRGDTVIFTFGYDDTLIIKKLDDETLRRFKDTGGQNEEHTITIE